ncbi:MAG: AI-2E family transporter [Firmicutes bacterium]|nr:AI-2E family transporter [Bacillota bacterium]
MNYNPQQQQALKKKSYLWLFVAVLAALLVVNIAGDTVSKMFGSLMAGLVPVIAAVILAVVLLSPMNWIERVWFKKLFVNDPGALGKKRALSLAILYTIVVIGAGLFLWLAIPNLINLVQLLYNNITDGTYIIILKDALISIVESFGFMNGEDAIVVVGGWIDDFVQNIADQVPTLLTGMLNTLTNVIGIVLSVALGVILSLFLLKDKEKISAICRRYTYAYNPRQRADDIVGIAARTNTVLKEFVVSNVIISAVLYVVTYAGLLIIGAPSPGFMALSMALFNIVPYIGGIAATVLIGTLTLVMVSPSAALLATLFAFAAWALVVSVVPPIVFKHRLKLSIGVVLFSLVVGGALFGIWGMIIAMPLVAVGQTVLKQRLEKREAANAGNGGSVIKVTEVPVTVLETTPVKRKKDGKKVDDIQRD